ncbi:uncharacterized protein CHSO_3240 [Chryseobacterium sp. StRB126]|nr:uncharacterized protein CHSO_3240 [Chryseobacterium sp. StRB126]
MPLSGNEATSKCKIDEGSGLLVPIPICAKQFIEHMDKIKKEFFFMDNNFQLAAKKRKYKTLIQINCKMMSDKL